MADYKSDLVTAYEAKARVRTINYRGSLLRSDCIILNKTLMHDENDIIYAGLIPFNASLKGGGFVLSRNSNADITIQFGIAGINRDGTYTEIGRFPINYTLAENTGYVYLTTMFDFNFLLPNSTLYEILDVMDQTNNTEKFKPYNKDRYGVIFFTNTAGTIAEEGEPAEPVVLNLHGYWDYVEGAPSDASIHSITDKKIS